MKKTWEGINTLINKHRKTNLVSSLQLPDNRGTTQNQSVIANSQHEQSNLSWRNGELKLALSSHLRNFTLHFTLRKGKLYATFTYM